MIRYRCDGCGAEMKKGDLRYRVSIDVRAAYDELVVGLAELVRDHRGEILELIEKLKQKDPREIEETVYKRIELDLCPACQRVFIHAPLRFHPELRSPGTPGFDVDQFLRSLGFGAGKGDVAADEGE